MEEKNYTYNGQTKTIKERFDGYGDLVSRETIVEVDWVNEIKFNSDTIIAIGDTHGRKHWKQIVSKESSAEKIVFIGDYFDSRENFTAAEQISNFKEILDFKRNNPDKVVLLFGNHEFHYLRSIEETYSGYQRWSAIDIQEEIENALAEGLLQMCYIHDNFLFSHAGITKTWLSRFGYSNEPVDSFVNDLFTYKKSAFQFKVGQNCSENGDDVCQSAIWVRPNSLMEDAIEGYAQIVGHTTMNNLLTTKDLQFAFIDTLGTSGEYLKITNGKMVATKI